MPTQIDPRSVLPEGDYRPEDDAPRPAPRAPSAASPIDEETPARRAPPKRKGGKSKVVVKESEEGTTVSVEGDADGGNGHGERSFEDESPLDADAESQYAMVEVERVGPGEGPGWEGMTYNGIPVSKGRVGYIPRTKDVYDRVQAIAGGAEYKFVTKGAPTVFKKLNGPPKALPGEDVDYEIPEDFELGEEGLYPRGRRPGLRGRQRPYGEGYGREPSLPPDEGDGITMEIPAGGPGAPGSGFPDGWVYVAATNSHWYMRDGRPVPPPRGSRPPAIPSVGGYNPGMYDHSVDKEEESEIKELKRELDELRRDKNKKDPMDAFMAMMGAQLEERKLQFAADQAKWEREKSEREAERRAQAQAAIDAAKATAEAAKETARIQADAAKETARLQAEAAKANNGSANEVTKQMLVMQGEHTKQLVTILTQKQESGGLTGLLEQHALIQDTFGGKGSDNAAVQVAEAVKQALPPVLDSIKDVVVTWRAGNVAPALPGQPAPASGAQQGQQTSADQVKELGRYLQLIGYVVTCANEGLPAKPSTLVHGCIAYQLHKQYDQVEGLVLQATPEQIVQVVDDATKKLGSPADLVEFHKVARESLLAPKGRAWLQALRESIVEKRNKDAQRAQTKTPSVQSVAPAGAIGAAEAAIPPGPVSSTG